MTTNKTIREAINVAPIEGYVSDIRIEDTKINGKDAISGEVDVLTSSDSIHTINVFSFKLNKEGKESGLYKGFDTIRREYKSIEQHGKELADKVRIEQAKIGKNEYVGQDGEFKSYPRLTANFINRIKDNDVFEPKAKFTLEMVVASMAEEKRNGEETGRLILKGYVPGYQETNDDIRKIFPFDVVVAESHSVNYVQNTYERGNTVTIFGEIINQTIVTKKEVDVGFGAPQEQVNRREVREFVVTGGTPPYDEDDKNAYSLDMIKTALKNREIAIEKKKDEKKAKTNNQNGNSNGGFGSKPQPADPFSDSGKPIDISDDDLPF